MAKISLLPLLVIGGLTACTGGDDAATTTTSTTTTAVTIAVAPVESQADAYFDALVANDANNPAAASAVPGSEAAQYAEYQVAARDLTGVTSTRTVVAGDQGFEICDTDAECTTYSAVTIDPVNGLVQGFSVGDVPLEGRIVGGGLVADRDGVVTRVASAYRSNDGEVFVLVEVDNTSDVPVELFGFAAVLDSEAGAAVEATGAWGSQQLSTGVDGQLLLAFPPVELGGQVRLSGLRGDGLDLSLEIPVPTPVP